MAYTPAPMSATHSLGPSYSSSPFTPTPNSNTERSRVLGSTLPQSPVDRFLDSDPWEYFELHELVKNRNVRELFNQQNLANEKVNRLLDDKEKLLNQLHDANKENQNLQAQLTQLQQQTAVPAARITENSGAAHFRPIMRPNNISPSVLWTLAEAQQEPGIFDPKNKSRPRMHLCIRDSDGTVISDYDYKSLQWNVGCLVKTHLDKLETDSPAAQNLNRTKKYYQEYHHSEYNTVLTAIEKAEPRVGHCANRWKADHLVGQHLLNVNSAPEKKDIGKNKRKSMNLANSQGEKEQNSSKRQRTAETAEEMAVGEKEGSSQAPQGSRPKSGEKQTSAGRRVASVSAQLATLGGHPVVGKTDKAASAVSTTETHREDSVPAQSQSATTPPSSEHVDVSLIVVDKSISGLKETLLEAPFNAIQDTNNLLNAFAACPNFTTSEPSEGVLALIKRIASADPNSPSFGPDENNENWGHSQFTSWSASLTNWASIGSTESACELLAASVKTCKVGRHLCFVRKPDATSFLADCYLDNIISKLWDLWKDAGGPVTETRAKPAIGMPASATVATTLSDTPQQSASLSVEDTSISREEVKLVIEPLTIGDFKKFADHRKVSIKKTANRAELAKAILDSPISRTASGFSELEQLRDAAKAWKGGGKKGRKPVAESSST